MWMEDEGRKDRLQAKCTKMANIQTPSRTHFLIKYLMNVDDSSNSHRLMAKVQISVKMQFTGTVLIK